METSGRMLLFQFDHLSGEETGSLIETLQDCGVANVQVIPAITKKNRPGHIGLVDIGTVDESRILRELSARFGISGYHRIETVHCYESATSSEAQLMVRCGPRELTLTIGCKRSPTAGAVQLTRIEHDDLWELARRIEREFGLKVHIPGLRRRIETLLEAQEPFVLDLTSKT